MAENSSNGSQRLDSWKAIASYLGRDERTVQRWERKFGLPVRRLPGGRGTSVFAYAGELDAWLAANQPSAAFRDLGEEPSPGVPPASGAPTSVPLQISRRPSAVAAAAILLAVVTGLGVWFVWRVGEVSAADLRVEFAPDGLTAYAEGRQVWRHTLPGQRLVIVESRVDPVDVLPRAPAAVIAGTGLRVTTATDKVDSGQLWSFSPSGALTRTFAFDDRIQFQNDAFESPWGITDFRVNEANGDRRIAVAAHHHEWWPGLVTVLDEGWRRISTFVHAGWIERIVWLRPDRLLVAGFSNARDGGMVALLDPRVPLAQGPVDADSAFHCAGCGGGRPVRYAVMPRSEINRVTGSRFNRARVELNGDRIVVRTIEAMNSESEVVDALYEFTPQLELVRASWSARYWELHGKLEAAGMLDHTRASCPDRDGPREVLAWDGVSGWTALSPP